METQCKQKRRELLIQHFSFSNMNTVETQKAKEAERHRKLRLKKKNELTRLKCLEKFLCDKYKLIKDEPYLWLSKHVKENRGSV